jgi:Metallopeptidase toxin 4
LQIEDYLPQLRSTEGGEGSGESEGDGEGDGTGDAGFWSEFWTGIGFDDSDGQMSLTEAAYRDLSSIGNGLYSQSIFGQVSFLLSDGPYQTVMGSIERYNQLTDAAGIGYPETSPAGALGILAGSMIGESVGIDYLNEGLLDGRTVEGEPLTLAARTWTTVIGAVTLAETAVTLQQGAAGIRNGLKQQSANGKRDAINAIDDLADEMPSPDSVDFSESRRVSGEYWGADRISMLKKYLEKRGVTVLTDQDDIIAKLAARMKIDGASAAFIVDKRGKAMMLLSKNPTRREVLHELGHYLHFRKVGADSYRNLTTSQRESFVGNLLRNSNNWKRFNPDEQWRELNNLFKHTDPE